ASRCWALRLVSTRLAPSSAKRLAIAAPRPVPPPVTTMLRPRRQSSLNMSFRLLCKEVPAQDVAIRRGPVRSLQNAFLTEDRRLAQDFERRERWPCCYVLSITSCQGATDSARRGACDDGRAQHTRPRPQPVL